MKKRIAAIAVIVLIVMIGNVDARVATARTVAASQQPVVRSMVYQIDKNAILQKLDMELFLSVDNAWDERVDNLLFDLAVVDRNIAHDYSKKIRDKVTASAIAQLPKPIVEKPADGIIEIVKGKPVGAPVVFPVQPDREPIKVEQEEVILQPGEEPMKKAMGRPAPKKGGAPSSGPAKKLGVPSSGPKASTKPGAVVAPKAVEQIFSVPKLQVLDNDKLLELFAGLLDKLPTNWNGQVVEKVEEKTKYGSKIYNVYGAPISKWTNDINTLKKVLITKNVMPEAEIAKKIADRIALVRSEKNVKPAMVGVSEEKPKEEMTEQDLVRLIKGLLAEPKADQIGWIVSVKGNIKALDKINHAVALEYHDKFIKLTGEKPFLK
jgi:hypothetical protein